MITIPSWNEEKQTTEPVAITLDSKIRLGCEGEPETTVENWMSLVEIETIEEMATYIFDLDFNVEVIA
jgi:hypothetical protein